MSKQARLNSEQAIALMEQADEEGDWGNSEEEEDAARIEIQRGLFFSA